MARQELLSLIDPQRIPEHVAIIMDGNGRWAKKQGFLRIFGHRQGVHTVRNIVETAAELGVKYLTLYAFSTENWGRPKTEVNSLMQLLTDNIKKDTPRLMETGVRMQTIGNIEQLPASCIKTLEDTVEITKNNSRITLVLALNYSGRWDIIEAVRKIAVEVKEGTIDPETIGQDDVNTALNTAPYPNPDLLIRTSGEQRISNFLLWEIAYSEIYFTNVLWPEFSTEDFYRAIIDYQGRERRFGKTGEQIGQVK